ncbi:MAG: HAMP domain-containing protein [Acidobacteria bacterium]|nr:HAMP domain-containing protein [Acidobacteriota bacterium]
MRALPIGARLTLWYFGIFAVTFVAYGTAMLLAMRTSVEAVIDDELQARLQGVQRMLERFNPAVSLAMLQEELREHSGLRPGGDLLQVSGPDGAWLFQSRSIREYGIEQPTIMTGGSRYDTIERNGQALRILTAPVAVSGIVYTAQVAAPVAEAHAILARFRWLLIVSVPPVLLLACAAGYWMSRRALAPVDAITEAARSTTAQDLSRRLEPPGTADELQRLTVTFNEMLARLQASFAQITRFTADASHELRTPVALVRSTAELTLRHPRGAQEYREALTEILNEAERMTGLIANLLTLARVDAGSETLSFEDVDVGSLLRQASSRCEPLAHAKQIQGERTIGDESVLVRGDPRALERLFVILIDNAIRYTPEGGQVRVGVKAVDDAAVVTVADTGIGIPAEEIPLIFERFYRVDPARSREAGGAGLGLSIGHWIAEAHHASIHVDSTPGEGSVFEVRIPRAAGFA